MQFEEIRALTLSRSLTGPETLPIFLDVGTDNKEALENPNYIGWRHARLKGVEYFAFVDEFVQLVKEFFPHAMLQWEDFNIDVAIPLLNKYRGELCSFNDDNQGTAAIATGALLAACEQAGTPLSQQKVVMVGSGSAGCGIAWYVMKVSEKVFCLFGRNLLYCKLHFRLD